MLRLFRANLNLFPVFLIISLFGRKMVGDTLVAIDTGFTFFESRLHFFLSPTRLFFPVHGII